MTPQYRPNFRVSQMVAGARRRNSPADLLERGERVLPLFMLPASLFSIAFTGQGLFDWSAYPIQNRESRFLRPPHRHCCTSNDLISLKDSSPWRLPKAVK